LGLKSLETQSAQTFFIFKLLHNRGTLPFTVYQWLHACSPWCQRHCTADDCAGCWCVVWTDSLLDSFMLTVAASHPSKHSAMTCGIFFTCGFLLTPRFSKTTRWYTFVLNITFHCPWQHTTDRHSHPTKTEPTASSATIYRVNVQRPLTHNMHISWMARYFFGHITSMNVNNLWMALVEQEYWNLILYTFHAVVVHKFIACKVHLSIER
jgi:hypothetical protein